jgi:hypothetical protein
MESTLRAPRTGDTVIVFAKMQSGRLTELSGHVEEVSADHAYFALDSIHLMLNDKDDGYPLEAKKWPETAKNLLRVGVPLDEMKPFDGDLDEDAPCWLIRM